MQSLLQNIRAQLSDVYSPEELRGISLYILEKITGCSRAEILANKITELSVKKQHELEKILARLKNFEPVQYVFGKTEFYGLPFFVNSDVLIPRPETEELVDWIIKQLQITNHELRVENQQSTRVNSDLRILDVGTGSGCIAIALAKNLPQCSVTAIDISPEALAIAQKNAEQNGVSITFLEENIFSFDTSEKYDIIVSNPPYVCEMEKNEIAENVLNYEPHLALFVANENPLIFYEAIAGFAKKQLNKGGFLYFEINRAFGGKITEMLRKKGFGNVQLRKDLFGNDRMLRAMINC